MGRPLYPQSFHAPIVRVDPEPEAYPTPAKWSYWNRFDPDADEFFENDEAVYEAVIDASQPPVRIQTTGESVLVAAEDGNSSSDGSSTGRDTPLDEFSHPRDAAASGWRSPEASPQRISSVQRIVSDFHAEADATENEDLSFNHSVTFTIHTLESRSHERRLVPITASPNSPIPDPALRRPPSPSPATLLLDVQSETSDSQSISVRDYAPATPTPSTSPHQRSVLYGTPSPAPSVTPRLFQWSILPVAAVQMSPSPSPAGPLTNYSARRSVTHVNAVPSLISPMHRVVG